MKQFLIKYTGEGLFESNIESWKKWKSTHNASAVFIHIMANSANPGEVDRVTHIIDEKFPEAIYAGCSASGTVFGGNVSDDSIVVCCAMLEKSDCDIRLLSVDLNSASLDETEAKILSEAATVNHLAAIEVIFTLGDYSTDRFCAAFDKLPREVQVFGGAAFGDNETDSYVFAKGLKTTKNTAIIIYYGGSELHFFCEEIEGWKAVGMPTEVTKADGNILYTLDDKPAYEIYHKYLRIPNDSHLFYNALEFPFEFALDDRRNIRRALSCNPDGSMKFSGDVKTGSIARITYGDPKLLIHDVEEGINKVKKFRPQCQLIFSSFGRRTFWGLKETNREVHSFYDVAPASGFFSSGEIIRENGVTKLDNLAIVVAGIREGAAVFGLNTFPTPSAKKDDSNMTLVSRLASFIDAATSDLIEANEKLKLMAVTDQMTQIFNRGEIQKRIDEKVKEVEKNGSSFSLLMFDVDHFKSVNDTYGHAAGDEVLIKLAGTAKEMLKDSGLCASLGRWGGEEFMAILSCDGEEARKTAEELRNLLGSQKFSFDKPVTASFGVTEYCKGDTADGMAGRVDKALYSSKENGRNRVTVL